MVAAVELVELEDWAAEVEDWAAEVEDWEADRRGGLGVDAGGGGRGSDQAPFPAVRDPPPSVAHQAAQTAEAVGASRPARHGEGDRGVTRS